MDFVIKTLSDHILARGYTIQLGDETLNFPLAERSPSEGYLTNNYAA